MATNEFYIGQTFEDQLPEGVGHWCEWHFAHIEKNNNIYTIIKNSSSPIKVPTTDELKERVRKVRDSYIDDIEWRVDRYRDQTELGITTTDTQAEYQKILQYQQYLRDYPQSETEWWLTEPLTYNDWKVSQ